MRHAIKWCLVLLILVPVAANLLGCETDSFIDPSKTGRFEFYPTTIPVLDRIDVIEPKQDYWVRATNPSTEDLLPRELAYYIYPGDTITLSIFELYQTGQWSTVTRQVDAGGYYRVPELGDVRAAGLTAQQLEDEVKRQLTERVIRNPQVDVVLEQSRGLRYTVYGYVQNPGVFNLDNPNLRLLDALAIAGGVPITTDKVYVIRQVILTEEMKPGFEQQNPAVPPTTAPGQRPPSVEELIEQMDRDKPKPPVSPGMLQDRPDQQPPPVDVDQLEPVRVPTQPPVDVDVVKPTTQPSQPGSGDSFIYVEERGEWVRVPGQRPEGQPAEANKPPTEPNMVLDRIIEIDYQSLARGASTLNVVIRPSDRIYVEGPVRGLVYIDGEIVRPGVYSLPDTGRLTLSRFVASAGGLGAIAIPERVDLVRVVGHDREAKIRLDLAAIRQGTEPDIYMKPDDHIIIGTSFWAVPLAIIRNGFRATYGYGFILDRNFGNDVFGSPPGSTSGR